jgi:transcriptional regulator with XRE-family HTH domain
MPKSVFTAEYKVLLEKLRQARIDSDMTQQEVAKRLKKPQSYISKVEAGERRIDPVELKQLARLYQKVISYFLS